MRDYSIVTPAFWIGETGKKLRGDKDAQIVAMYLMTSPHSTMTGVFHCPILYIAHETGLSIEGASKGLASLLEGGFCMYEEASETVFVIRMASFQIAPKLKPGDNRIVGLNKEVQKMPSSYIREQFLAIYAEPFCLENYKPLGSPSKAPPKPGTGTGTGTGKIYTPTELACELFDSFWEAYPKKVGKDSALKAFAKRDPDAELLELMIKAVAMQSTSKQWLDEGGKFIPNPATWLNGGRWKDVPQELSTVKRGSEEYAKLHKTAAWWSTAGFDNVWNAMSAGCYHDTSNRFSGGKKLQQESV